MVFQVSLESSDKDLPNDLTCISPPIEPIHLVREEEDVTEDQKIITSLFEQYNGKICTYLVHIVGDSEAGRDLAQDTFLKAWQALPSLRDLSQAEAWLFRIARNKALDYLRRKTVRQIVHPWTVIEENEISSNSNIDAFENVEAIKQALAQVKPKFRECLILYVIVGLSQKKIADILHIKESSVSVYVGLGRKEFRKAFEQSKEE